MVYPEIFIVGFQKCGSSTLFDLLCRHPDIQGTSPKETFFLADPDYDNYDYENNIENPAASWDRFLKDDRQGKQILEASVCNFYQKNALAFLRDHPTTKAIFIVRNPLDRFKSNYKYYHGKIGGIPADVSLEQYFELVQTKPFDQDSLNFALEHGRYGQHIERWKEALGPERVHVVGFEQLIKNHQPVLDGLFDFLSLPRITVESLSHANASRGFVAPGLNKKLVSWFGGTALSNPLTKRVYQQLFMRKVAVAIPAELRASLEDFYRAELETFGPYFQK